MIYDEILQFLGQQNFALTNVTGANFHVLANQEGGEMIFCVPMRSGDGKYVSESLLNTLCYQALRNYSTSNILFILVTDDVERDKHLAQMVGINLWIVDEQTRDLRIYENQPDDFYGLKYGLYQAITQSFEAKKQAVLGKKNIPFVTIVLIAINVIWSLKGDVNNASYMASMGASYGPYVFERFQFWRLITSMFMHFGIMHLMGNMIYLFIAGLNLERVIGHWKYLALYFMTGFGASLISTAFYYLRNSDVVSAGASGAIYGLIGAVVVLTFKNRGRTGRGAMWIRIGIVLMFLFYSNFMNTRVDAVAHIAGFGLGILLMIAFNAMGRKEKKRERS